MKYSKEVFDFIIELSNTYSKPKTNISKNDIRELLNIGVIKAKVSNDIDIVYKLTNSEFAKAFKFSFSQQLEFVILKDNNDETDKNEQLCLSINSEGKYNIIRKSKFLLDSFVDNIALVSYIKHPCYRSNVAYGIIIKDNGIYTPLYSEYNALQSDINKLTNIGKPSNRFFDMYISPWSLKIISQNFWGYHTEFINPEITVYDEHLTYEFDKWNSHPNGDGYYIFFDSRRINHCNSKQKLQEYLAKYDIDKQKGDLSYYNNKYAI